MEGLRQMYAALVRSTPSAWFRPVENAGTAAARDGQDERFELVSPYTKCQRPAGLSAAFRRRTVTRYAYERWESSLRRGSESAATP